MPSTFSSLLEYADRVAREARRRADTAADRAAAAGDRADEVQSRVVELQRSQGHRWSATRQPDVVRSGRRSPA